MAWLLLLLGTSAGVSGFLSLANTRLAIDKIESLLLFLIAAVLITGGAVVRAIDRSRVVVELEEAIRGRLAPRPELASIRDWPTGLGSGEDPAHGGTVGSPFPGSVWDEEAAARQPRRFVQVMIAAFLAVAAGLLGLWLVVTNVR